MKKHILSITLLLVACSSTPSQIQYYQLPDSALKNCTHTAPSIGVRVLLATPLKSNSLLYQTHSYILNFAQQNLWAAPLDEMLTASVVNKLNQYSQKWCFVPSKVTETTSLTLYFDRFQGSYTGETEINGYRQWQGKPSIAFHVSTPQQGNGYPAMLESLDTGLDKMAQSIINEK